MKELAVDESLSEEARDSARKALEVLVSSQLLDIEQAAALRKLESEAQFVNQQARIEQNAALEKQEADALAGAKKVEVEALAEVKKLEAEAQSKRKKAEAKKLLQEAEGFKVIDEGLSDEMAQWLRRHRLQSCAADVARIAGA